MNRTISSVLVAAMAVTVATGCSWSKKAQGAVIGAGAGAAAGAVVGNQTGSTTRGAIIGAAVGGAAGAIIGHQMDQHARELAYEIPGATVQRIGEGIAITFPDGLLFPFDSDQLHNEARANLVKLAASMTKYPNTSLTVVGHTDDVGANDYNQALSERRATSAGSFIAANGVARTRISTVGVGESEPITSNNTDSGRSLNRRVEVAIYGGG